MFLDNLSNEINMTITPHTGYHFVITLKTLFFWTFLVAGGWPIQFICKKCNNDDADHVDGGDDDGDIYIMTECLSVCHEK